MRLTFIGTGDAFGTGGRFHTCLLLDAAGQRGLIDCGASAIAGLHRLGVKHSELDVVLVSHLHGDHFGGLPFILLDSRYNQQRDKPLVIAGPPTIETRVRGTLEHLYPGTSERVWGDVDVAFRELRPDAASKVGAWEVEVLEVVHPSGAPSYGIRVRADGRLLAFSGDTEWTDALEPLSRGADLFVCECFSWDTPVPNHVRHEQLAAARDRLASRVILTHMGPEMLPREAASAFPFAHDGMVVDV